MSQMLTTPSVQLTGTLPAYMANASEVQFMKLRGNKVYICIFMQPAVWQTLGTQQCNLSLLPKISYGSMQIRLSLIFQDSHSRQALMHWPRLSLAMSYTT